MIDLKKPPDEKTLDKIAKIYNSQYRLSLSPYIATIICLPVAFVTIFFSNKLNIYGILILLAIIILAEYYMIKYLLKKLKI